MRMQVGQLGAKLRPHLKTAKCIEVARMALVNQSGGITDAGWMALSSDRGTAEQKTDQGFGVVCDIEGRPYPDLIVMGANETAHELPPRRSAFAHNLP